MIFKACVRHMLRTLQERDVVMQAPISAAEVRQKILLLKEIPPMPFIAQKILCMSPDAEVAELAATIEQSPEIAARLLGMANAAYFGWPGGVRTVFDAIYKVLGIKLVKSIVLGIALSKVFDVKRCRGFQSDQYWFTAMVTAQFSQVLFPTLDANLRQEIDNIHLNGLLHNLGIPILAHLFPEELSLAFSRPVAVAAGSTTERIRAVLGIDQTQAAGWLSRKWHLPRDIVCVMERHKDPAYRGDFWPIVSLVGYCERLAQEVFLAGVFTREPDCEALLGIGDPAMERLCQSLEGQLEDLRSMAALMAAGESND
jgi:HD-like signal output (HDOD) protein